MIPDLLFWLPRHRGGKKNQANKPNDYDYEEEQKRETVHFPKSEKAPNVAGFQECTPPAVL